MNKFIEKNFIAFTFCFIILLSVFLRFYQLDSNPPSLNWDEVSLGYNAYSILKTGADEYGTKLPLSIRSFGDYKPPLYTYLAVLPIKLFGLNEFSVRFPAAVIGALSVIAIYFLVREILQKWDRKYQKFIAVVSAFFLAISPWHLQFSRGAFEGNVGMFFLILSLFLFFKAFQNKYFYILFAFSFVLSVYSYHSFRLINPILLIVLFILFYKKLIRQRILVLISIVIIFLFSLPIYANFISSSGTDARLSMVTIFSEPTIQMESAKRVENAKRQHDLVGEIINNRRIFFLLAIIKGYFDHLNFDFLFVHGDGGVQHHAYNMGMLYLWDLPFIMLGALFLFKKIDRRILLLFILFFLAPFPASITTGTPHPVRAIAMIPAFQIFSAVGFIFVLLFLQRYKFAIVANSIIIVALLLNLTYYLKSYYIDTPIKYGYFWQYGNKEAIEYARQHEDEYKKIVMTYKIDQPYIYYLFYNKIDPFWYQNNWAEKGNIGRFERKIGKYEFRYIDFNKDSKEKDTLLIGVPEEIPLDTRIIKEIRYLDGSVAYRIAKT